MAYRNIAVTPETGAGGLAGGGDPAERRKLRLNRFLEDVQRRAWRMARLATRNSDEAFDIVQDAMIKLVEKYGDKPDAELLPLFHCILQSRIRDWYRRNTVRNRLLSWFSSGEDEAAEDPLENVADPGSRSGEDWLASERAIEALNVALSELPLRQQQVFLLRAWEGLDTRQTAAAMNCAEGSVKAHYSRALEALRNKLGAHWHD